MFHDGRSDTQGIDFLLTSCDVGWIHLHIVHDVLRYVVSGRNNPHLVMRTTMRLTGLRKMRTSA